MGRTGVRNEGSDELNERGTKRRRMRAESKEDSED